MLSEFAIPKSNFLLIILTIWDMIWRGWALWRSARREEKWWFVALLIINSIGILPIIYLVFFSKDKKRNKVGILSKRGPTS